MGMRGAWLPALGVALLAAGFGLGIVVAGSREPLVISNVTPAPSSPATEPPPAEAAPAATDAAPSTAPPSPGAAPALSPADRDALRAILDRLPRDAVPTGTGSITGQVKTEDGTPVPGVEVAFWPERPRPTPAARAPQVRFNQRAPEESAVDSFLSARWFREAMRIATTDAAGRYRVEGLSDDPHRGNALLAGWSLQARPPSDSYRAGAVVDFVATPSIEVFVELSCPDGPLPEFVQLRSTNPQFGGWGIHSRGGSIRLKPGSYEVYALGGEQETLRSETQTVEILQGAVGPTLRFELKARPGIRGRVILPDGQESDDTRVLLARLSGDVRPDPAALRTSGRESQGRPARDRMSFFFPDLPAGRYALGAARMSGGPIVAVEEVEVGAGQVERDIRLPSPDPAEFVAVTVLGPGGEVLRDYSIMTGWKSGGSSSMGGSAVVRQPDGSRWVFHHEVRGSPAQDGTHSITVTSREHGSATLEYRKGERTEWTVRLEPPGRVEARLTGPEGTAYHGRLRFQLAPASSDPNSYYGSSEGTPDASGLQTFASIQPGDYVLVLVMSYGHSQVPIARIPVTVRSGKNEFSVPLPRLHEVVVTGAEGNVLLRSVSEKMFAIHVPATEGRALFDGIPEGEYVVTASRKQQNIRVSGPTKVEL